jgi:hypothetical protein
MPFEEGRELLSKLQKKSKYIVIIHPNLSEAEGGLKQGASFGNRNERHVSIWKDFDFKSIGAFHDELGLVIIKNE